MTAPRALVRQFQTESAITPTQVKVKVTHLLATNYDALTYNGDIKADYPKTIGRTAIGIVTEKGEKAYGVEKGARVYLEPTRPCRECLNCKSGKTEDCSDVKTAGTDFDGFLRDFVVCEYTDVAPVPDSVDDMHALCIENVALAENIFNRLDLPQGAKVAIAGSGFTANIIAQIALYHKLIPIVICDEKGNLDRMKRCGVFYSFEYDDNIYANVADATSGAMCDAAVFTTCCTLDPAEISKLLANGKDFVLGGFANVSFQFDSRPVFRKKLRVYSVTDGYDYTEVAINMLVHGAVNLDNFEKTVLSEFDPASILEEKLKTLSHSSSMTVLKLIF